MKKSEKKRQNKKIKKMTYFTIPHLDRYQKEGRTKEWIKLWKKIMKDFKFCQLNDAEKWYFIGLMFLAVENDNVLPNDPSWVCSMVAQRHSKSKSKVVQGMTRMFKLGLISPLRVRKEKKRKEEIKLIKTNDASKGLKGAYNPYGK